MALSEGGQFLAFTGDNKEVNIVRISQKKCWELKRIETLEDITALAFSFNGKMLAYTF